MRRSSCATRTLAWRMRRKRCTPTKWPSWSRSARTAASRSRYSPTRSSAASARWSTASSRARSRWGITTSRRSARSCPTTAVFNTPFVYRDAEHSLRATDARTSPALQKVNQELVEKGNMRIVASFFQGTRELTSKEKVLSPKDMQGKKYRGVPIKLWSSMLTGMGAVATPVEVSELATALATGLVVGPGEPAAEHLHPEALRGAEVRDDDQPHAVGAVGVRQREGVAEHPGRRPQDHGGHDGRGRRARRSTGTATPRQVPQGPRGARAWCSSRRRTASTSTAFRKAVLAQVNKDFPEWTGYIEQIRAVK